MTDARTQLLDPARGSTDPEAGTIEHAIALFQRRDAEGPAKRSAIVALAGILQDRRSILKQHLLSKDEDALFEIANRFDLRHQNASQQPDYDPMFLDWIFWWYLATIELTQRFAQQSS